MRITPAYAGKRKPLANGNTQQEDHPRLRGEKVRIGSQYEVTRGSPPLTRGKESTAHAFSNNNRITPAYAGKSPFLLFGFLLCWDHPRLRGEKPRTARRHRAGLGSPPLTRGKVPSLHSLNMYFGITPAYAGKSVYS